MLKTFSTLIFLSSLFLVSNQILAADEQTVYQKRMPTGSSDQARLLNQHLVNEPYSREHLLAVGNLQGETVADLGTGGGHMLPILSDLVGPDGLVIAIDSCADQLNEAKKLVAEKGLTNVVFFQGDITNNEDVQRIIVTYGPIKAVFSRFVIMHIEERMQATKNIFALLASGGYWLSEETVSDMAESTDKQELFDQYRQFVQKKYAADGLNYRVYEEIPNLGRGAGFSLIYEHTFKKRVTVEQFLKSVLLLMPMIETATEIGLLPKGTKEHWQIEAQSIDKNAEIYLNGLSCVTFLKP